MTIIDPIAFSFFSLKLITLFFKKLISPNLFSFLFFDIPITENFFSEIVKKEYKLLEAALNVSPFKVKKGLDNFFF